MTQTAAVSPGRHENPLTPEQRNLVFLQSYAAVNQGRACWRLRWQAVTYGMGPPGLDERFGRTGGAAGS